MILKVAILFLVLVAASTENTLGEIENDCNDTSLYPIHYWDMPPFVYQNKKEGEVRGILPKIFIRIVRECATREVQWVKMKGHYQQLLSFRNLSKDEVLNQTLGTANGNITLRDIKMMMPILTTKLIKMTDTGNPNLWDMGRVDSSVVIVQFERIKVTSKIFGALEQCSSLAMLFGSFVVFFGFAVYGIGMDTIFM